jgi:myosin heavy subunit
MSREKMLQAEVALKDEQLADLTNEVERLQQRLEESEKLAQNADQIKSQNVELKQVVSKLLPAAKKTAQYAAELNETHRRLAIVEKERSDLAKNCSLTNAQAAALKSQLAEVQGDARSFDAERKEAARRARKAEAIAKAARRRSLMTIIVAALVCAGTIGAGYAYVTAALKPPAELSEEAAAAFKQYAPEYRGIVELAMRSEREKLNRERENLAAERNRIREFDDETMWDKIVSYGWLILIFGGGFVVGVITIIAAFVFGIR